MKIRYKDLELETTSTEEIKLVLSYLMGKKKTKTFYPEKLTEKFVKRHCKTWTRSEVKLLRTLYNTGSSLNDIATALDRTENGVRCKASKIGLLGK